MTILRAPRYRIRKLKIRPSGTDAAVARAMPFSPEGAEDGFDPAIFRPRKAEAAPAQETAEQRRQALDAILNEGLTGRQFRLARRIALRQGINVTTDAEAVLELRRRGIDPFDRALLLTLDSGAQKASPPVVNGTVEDTAPDATGGDLIRSGDRTPAPRRAGALEPMPQLPPSFPRQPPPGFPGFPDEAERAREVLRIQRDIIRRRRRKLAMLALRLAFFVLLPTLIAGWYYFMVATPLYATKTEMVIQKADSANAGAGLGGLFSGTQLATNQDSITVQSFLQSREAMLRLDEDQHFKDHFSTPDIDPLQRLPENASNEAAYKLYQKMVKIGYDPSEGVIRMEVSAADPQTSERFSQALIRYAEQQVDQLTYRLREDQMRGARESYGDAEAKVQEAQARVLTLQQQVGILDPVSENSLVMSQLGTLQTQLEEKRLQLSQLLDNAQPSSARVEGVRGDISRLEASIAAMRGQLTQATGAGESLAAAAGQLRIAEADLQTRQALLAAAAAQMETARIEANRQVRYLETGVRPVAPDEPTYPRAFEYTLLAFLIFSGIYLMMSLTASILREQVSS
ncbi:capsule biosynthesis protein [Paenirhodobacter populi]|uniref:Capsule biosynthesis protein n=1 Tax=Paenirhodobacter populi TaxID=2306993 RepID=A0A443ITL9_9RHOB|nr:capsule biosynthesis protein [Sinirhodobacter populi]RWR11045.1 capsule biosynthesis protein [Sinirhodobacter populi]